MGSLKWVFKVIFVEKYGLTYQFLFFVILKKSTVYMPVNGRAAAAAAALLKVT